MGDATIHSLPPEIARLVCDSLDGASIASIRLVSRFWNDIASPFLLHKPTVIFKKDSLDRLINISEHSYFSKLVTGVTFEPNTLEHKSRQEWENEIPTPRVLDDKPSKPPIGATEREVRVFRRSQAKLRNAKYRYSRARLNKAWGAFEDICQEQEELRRTGYGTLEFKKAFGNFPNLKEICMNHGWALWIGPMYTDDEKRNPYAQALTPAGEDNWRLHPSGEPQFLALVLAVHDAELKLQTLRIGSVSWQFLMLEGELSDKMRDIMVSLKRFEVHISTGYDFGDDNIGIEIPECRDDLDETSSLADLLSAAPKLEDLRIVFDWSEPYCPADLDTIVHCTTWPFLRVLTLESVETSEEVFLSFFARHPTIKELVLGSIELSSGKWVEVLEEMRNLLTLEHVWLDHQLTGVDPQQVYYLHPGEFPSIDNMRAQGNRTRVALIEYMIDGGVCPLRDTDAHPNQSEHQD